MTWNNFQNISNLFKFYYNYYLFSFHYKSITKFYNCFRKQLKMLLFLEINSLKDDYTNCYGLLK